MMSFMRSDYSSAEEWLTELKADRGWQNQQNRLQKACPDEIISLRAKAELVISKGEMEYLWGVHGHCVESMVAIMWTESSMSMVKLMSQTTAMLTINWIEQLAASSPDVAEALTGRAGEKDEEQFHFVHPEATDEQAWQIHNEVKRLVTHFGLKDIYDHLSDMKKEHKVLLPSNAENLYNELVRMGMSDGEGYSLKTFRNYYSRPSATGTSR